MNKELLELKRIGVTVTFKCTLKCKLCGMGIPFYKNPQHIDFGVLCKQIERFFSIIDYVENFEISGGETFLYPQLAKLLDFVMNFKEKFDKITLYTNGTILPQGEFKSKMESYNDICTIFISNYGALSCNAENIVGWCEEKNISYKIKKYYGDDLHCGGWVDFGDFYQKSTTYHKCVYLHDNFCAQLRKGQLHMCGRSFRAMELGAIVPNEDEYIDMLCDQWNEQLMKEKLQKMFSLDVLSACYSCNGLCDDSPRYVPAQQLVEGGLNG